MALPLSQLQALESLWESAGGAPGLAPQMAAIADAESGGNQSASNSYVDSSGRTQSVYGLWQISTVHAGALAAAGISGWELPSGSFANAQAAVDVSGNGANLAPWQAWDGYIDVVNGTNTSGLTAAQKQQAYATIAADLATIGGTTTPSPAAQTTQSTAAASTATPVQSDDTSSLPALLAAWFTNSLSDAQSAQLASIGVFLGVALGIVLVIWVVMGTGSDDEEVVVTAPAPKRVA